MAALHTLLTAAAVVVACSLQTLTALEPAATRDDGRVLVEVGAHHFRRDRDGSDLIRRDAPAQAEHAMSAVAQPAVPTTNSTADVLAGNTRTSNLSAAAMIVILCFSLFGLIWIQRDRFRDSSKAEKMATSCVLLYVALTIGVDILIRRFHQQDGNKFNFSPAVMTTLIEIGKLAGMAVGALVDWQNTRECTAAEFGKTMLLMTVPAACFVALNLGRYAALSGADLDQYRVWRCTDIIWVAVLWFTLFKKRPGRNQICGIALVFLSCTMMHHQDQAVSGRISPLAILTILGIALVSSLGLVMNEFGLKASAQLSLFMQSIALYSVTTFLNCLVVAATVPRTQIFQGISSPQVILIVLDVVLGISVACVLKYANAMVKQLASGWLAPLEPLIGHFVVGTPVTPTMVFATVFAGAGSIVYKIPEPEDTKEQEKRNGNLENRQQSENQNPEAVPATKANPQTS